MVDDEMDCYFLEIENFQHEKEGCVRRSKSLFLRRNEYIRGCRNQRWGNRTRAVDNRPELLREPLFQNFTQTHHHDRPEKGCGHGMVGVADSSTDVVRNRNFGTFHDVEMLLGLARSRQ